MHRFGIIHLQLLILFAFLCRFFKNWCYQNTTIYLCYCCIAHSIVQLLKWKLRVEIHKVKYMLTMYTKMHISCTQQHNTFDMWYLLCQPREGKLKNCHVLVFVVVLFSFNSEFLDFSCRIAVWLFCFLFCFVILHYVFFLDSIGFDFEGCFPSCICVCFTPSMLIPALKCVTCDSLSLPRGVYRVSSLHSLPVCVFSLIAKLTSPPCPSIVSCCEVCNLCFVWALWSLCMTFVRVSVFRLSPVYFC